MCHSLANYSVTFDSSRRLNGRLFSAEPLFFFKAHPSVYPRARVIIDSAVEKETRSGLALFALINSTRRAGVAPRGIAMKVKLNFRW